MSKIMPRNGLPPQMEKELEKPGFVQWDRFITVHNDGNPIIRAYGWIDRDKDEYKDFVLFEYWRNTGGTAFLTSSSEKTEELHKIWYDDDLEGHNTCKRVENYTDIDNVVRLEEKQQKTLDEAE